MILCAFTTLTSSRGHSLRKKQACEKRELKRAFIQGARVRSRGIRVKQRCLFLKFFLERLSRSHPLFSPFLFPFKRLSRKTVFPGNNRHARSRTIICATILPSRRLNTLELSLILNHLFIEIYSYFTKKGREK